MKATTHISGQITGQTSRQTSGSSILRLAAVVAALLLALAGCGGDDSDDDGSASESTSSATASDGAGDGAGGGVGDGGSDSDDSDSRAFEVDDDAVIQAVLAATQAEKAEWDGATLMVHFAEGSSEDPTSGAKCGAAVVLADDEKMVLRYPDGEIDCSQR